MQLLVKISLLLLFPLMINAQGGEFTSERSFFKMPKITGAYGSFATGKTKVNFSRANNPEVPLGYEFHPAIQATTEQINPEVGIIINEKIRLGFAYSKTTSTIDYDMIDEKLSYALKGIGPVIGFDPLTNRFLHPVFSLGYYTSVVDYHGNFEEEEDNQGKIRQLQPKFGLEANIKDFIRIGFELSTNYVNGLKDQPADRGDFLEPIYGFNIKFGNF